MKNKPTYAMKTSPLTRWPDGRIRARASWEPELRGILADDVARRGITWQGKVEELEDLRPAGWGTDFRYVLEVCRTMTTEDKED